MARKEESVSEYLARIGRKGGQAEVAKGLAKLSPERRREIARKGALARAKKIQATKKNSKKQSQ